MIWLRFSKDQCYCFADSGSWRTRLEVRRAVRSPGSQVRDGGKLEWCQEEMKMVRSWMYSEPTGLFINWMWVEREREESGYL